MTSSPGPQVSDPEVTNTEVVVIGGGQAGLAAGYFLRRAGVPFVILDGEQRPGGAWQHYWDSLHLFSPAAHSPLPGWPMPKQPGVEYPSADHVVDYLTAYEVRYELPVRRPVTVRAVRDDDGALAVETDRGTWRAGHVISATGSWRRPHRPRVPGGEDFAGEQRHTVDYRRPDSFAGQRVVVVGGGNSAAQILADLAPVAETTWCTLRPPRLMPDDVDGRVLFDVATQRAAARRHGQESAGVGGLGDIVMVPSVRAARDRGALVAHPMFDRIAPDGVAWEDGSFVACDAIIWCTGFMPDLGHLAPLGLPTEGGMPRTELTCCLDEPRLHLLGYGDRTGFASATLIGAGRTAKGAVAEITRG